MSLFTWPLAVWPPLSLPRSLLFPRNSDRRSQRSFSTSSCVYRCVAIFRYFFIVDVEDVDVLVSEGVSITVVFYLTFCTIEIISLSGIFSSVSSWHNREFA